MSFGADTLLITAFVLSLGVPIYYVVGLVVTVSAAAVYVISITLVSSLMPAVTWWLRWGRPDRHTASSITLVAFAYVTPAVAAVVIIVGMGYEMALLGVSVMAYIAGVVTVVVARRFGSSDGLRRMEVVRVLAAIGTPMIVLGLSSRLPYGAVALGGWSIPMLVAVAGAFGGGRGLKSVLSGGMGSIAEPLPDRAFHRVDIDD